MVIYLEIYRKTPSQAIFIGPKPSLPWGGLPFLLKNPEKVEQNVIYYLYFNKLQVIPPYELFPQIWFGCSNRLLGSGKL